MSPVTYVLGLPGFCGRHFPNVMRTNVSLLSLR